MSRFLNKKYLSLKECTPGEQPQDQQYIKLNTNESPYPPSKSVLDAVNSAEVSKLNLYSDPECKLLKNKLAEIYGVKKENIYVSNGSDDILNFSFMAFCGDEVEALFPEISYGFYKVYADLYGVKYSRIPLKDDFTIDINNYCNQNKFIVIANPNAPTGIALTLNEIEQIVKSNPNNVVLIDEAYVDFGADSAYNLTKKYDNLLVVMTYSKSRSLAGARLGFAIGNEEIIKDLEKIKFSTNPYSINRLTLLAGVAALESDSYYKDNAQRIIEAREYTVKELEKLGFDILPSKANFVFAKADFIGGEELYSALKSKGILVRHFSDEKIKDFNRITIGTKEQMQKLIEAIAVIKGEVKWELHQ